MAGNIFCERVCCEGKGYLFFNKLKIFGFVFGMKCFCSGIFGFVDASLVLLR